MSSGERGCDLGRLAHEILVYVAKHPHAQDTVEGIVHWWLQSCGIECDMSAVGDALATLVGRDLIVEIHGSDARVHYRMRPDQHEEIRAHIRQCAYASTRSRRH
jgi:hypothetical protein